MRHTLLTLITALALSTTLTLADITPKDGLWKAKMTSNNVTGCPSMMKSMIDKQGMKEMSKNVTFDKPFHPDSLFEESAQLKWKKVGTDKWKAVMTQGGDGMSVNITWSVGVVSASKMNIASSVRMSLPPQMAAMFGGSGECKADVLGRYNRISN